MPVYGFETITPFGRGKIGLVKITVAKDRCGHIRQHAGARGVISMVELKSWPDDGVTVSFELPEQIAQGAFRPTHLMEKISEAIVANPGLSSRAIRGAVSGKNDAKDLALELLVNEDYVEGGRLAPTERRGTRRGGRSRRVLSTTDGTPMSRSESRCARVPPVCPQCAPAQWQTRVSQCALVPLP